MNIFILILYSLPIIYLLYNVILYFFTRVPIVITPKKYYDELFKNHTFKQDSVIYELGCGRGDFLFAAEKTNPKKIVGFELSFIHVWQGKILIRLKGSKAKILHKNFFKCDISDADFIYLFLVKSILIKIWDKIKKETKPGTVVVSLSDSIPGEKYFKKIKTQPNKKKSTYYYLYMVS